MKLVKRLSIFVNKMEATGRKLEHDNIERKRFIDKSYKKDVSKHLCMTNEDETVTNTCSSMHNDNCDYMQNTFGDSNSWHCNVTNFLDSLEATGREMEKERLEIEQMLAHEYKHCNDKLEGSKHQDGGNSNQSVASGSESKKIASRGTDRKRKQSKKKCKNRNQRIALSNFYNIVEANGKKNRKGTIKKMSSEDLILCIDPNVNTDCQHISDENKSSVGHSHLSILEKDKIDIEHSKIESDLLHSTKNKGVSKHAQHPVEDNDDGISNSTHSVGSSISRSFQKFVDDMERTGKQEEKERKKRNQQLKNWQKESNVHCKKIERIQKIMTRRAKDGKF